MPALREQGLPLGARECDVPGLPVAQGREPGEQGRVPGLQLQGAFEVRGCGIEQRLCLAGPGGIDRLVGQIAPAQQFFQRFTSQRRQPRIRPDPALDRARHGPADLALQDEHIVQRALVAVLPQVRVGVRVDQLDVDLHPLAGAQHRALDEHVDAQLARDLRQRQLGALEQHRGGP
ncbi:MAG: hypothetical protein DYH17_06365 [Xanthomonadales bacterium PRO6]|nr:hypothetical protein [Xanthomonadales bacterium PRO6]